MARDWGPWTVIKLEALEKYFSAFTTACKYKAKRTLYLDLFGGRPDNRERTTGRVFPGSAVRAAMADPAFTRLIVSELSRGAADEQRTVLNGIAPGRVTVVAGDCNAVIPAELELLPRHFRWAPTFALADQYSAEISWETLRRLAAFKDPRAGTKVEICMFFGESFMVRGLFGRDGTVNSGYATRLDAMYGNAPGWRQIMAAREDKILDGKQVQKELVNLMRWQLENELGYATTLPLQVRNTIDRGIFSMIFATDHDVGSRIMTSLFEGADAALDLMVAKSKTDRRRAKDEILGQDALFGAEADLELTLSLSDEKPRAPILPPVPPWEYHRLWDRDQR